MDYICSAWNKVKSWWAPPKPCLLEPLNPRNKIMDGPPTLKELEKQLQSFAPSLQSRSSVQLKPKSQDLDKVVYFYKPKEKFP